NPANMQFGYFDTATQSWQPLTVTNPGQCPITATTTHFTTFSVVSLPSPAYCTDASHTDPFRGAGDINGDDVIDLADFSIFAGDFGKTSDATMNSPYSDMNCDGKVDLPDFSIFAAEYGM